MKSIKSSTSVYVSSMLTLCFLLLTSCATMDSGSSEMEPMSAATTMDMGSSEKSGINILFLGDNGHHEPADRIESVIPYFAEKGIQIFYTDLQDDLNSSYLSDFDVLMMYGNRTGLTSDQENVILNFVDNGGGFVAVHSASATFNDSDAFVNLVGAAFKSHGVGTFSTTRVEPGHPVFAGVPNIQSWDETYVHMKHNPDKSILSYRVEGNHREPWTWVRSHGEGRVFYTAWGHDERTWENEGFRMLLENGIRWSDGDDELDADYSPPQLSYGEGLLPFYPAGEPWGTVGDPITDVQQPLSPEESLDHIVVEPAFSIELFASEPNIVNPIDMTWDEAGRLWVVETIDYPNTFTEDRVGSDRIKVIEDTDGDGRADEFTIFAEGLNIATGIVLYDGGVIIAQAPDFIYLKDMDGDGRADEDEREVLFTGWGTFDTHAGPSNLQYGFDNQIWGVTGYSGFEGIVGGEEHDFSSGIYRFLPDGSQLEQISRTTNNTWGLGFSEDGSVLGSTANNDVPIHSIVPNRYYKSVRGPLVGQAQQRPTPAIPRIAPDNSFHPVTDNVLQVDQHGRYTAGSGFQIYTARDFPKEYWNKRAFIAEPTGHLLGEFQLEPNGSTYFADNLWSMLASQDAWFSPIQAKVGPDGALWVLDWYNLIIQHNPRPQDFEMGEGNAYVNDLRDKDHARIYRVIYKNSDSNESDFSLEGASPSELVDALSHDNMFWRLTAQRLLVERGESDVVSDLLDLVRDLSVDEIGLNPGAIHALWTLHGLGALDGSNQAALNVAYTALHHPSSGVRKTALMTIPHTQESLDHILAADFVPGPESPGNMAYTVPTGLMDAADAHVRVTALMALADMPSSERSGQAVAEMIVLEKNANDRWMRDAATAAASKSDESFLSRVLQKNLPQNADSTLMENVSDVVFDVARHYVMGDDTDSLAAYLLSLPDADVTIGSGFLGGVADGWPEDEESSLSDSQINSLSGLREALPEQYDESLNILAEKWGDAGLFGAGDM